MKKYRKANTLTSRGVYLRKHIARNRRRAKLVGLLYLVGIIALAAAACLPLIVHELAPVGVMTFWKTFMPKNLDVKTSTGLIKTINSGLYGLMLLGVVINVLKGLGKLGWLFKKKANKTYGFNRNVYAMDDLGRIFSGSLALIISIHFLIAIICGDGMTNVKVLLDKLLTFDMSSLLFFVIVAIAGCFFHLVLGFLGGKAAYYDVEDGEVIEHRRVVGRFAPLFRNVLQLAAAASIGYLLLQVNTLHTMVAKLLEKGGANAILKDMPALISAALQLVIVLSTLVLIKHATAATEFSIDGANGYGMKNFRVFSFFIFLAAGGAVAYQYLLGDKTLNKMMLIIAGIAFVMFVIELIMRKMPRCPGDKKQKKAKKVEDEIPLDSLPQFKPQTQVQDPTQAQKPMQSF